MADEREHLRPARPFDAPLSYQRRYLDQDLPDAIYGDHDDHTQERLRGAYFQQYSGRRETGSGARRRPTTA